MADFDTLMGNLGLGDQPGARLRIAAAAPNRTDAGWVKGTPIPADPLKKPEYVRCTPTMANLLGM